MISNTGAVKLQHTPVAQTSVGLNPQHAHPNLSGDEEKQGRGCDDALDSNDHGLEVFRGPVLGVSSYA